MACVCVRAVSEGCRGWLHLSPGTASHSSITGILSVLVSGHNPDFSKLVRSINVQKWKNGSWTCFYKNLYSRNLAEWVQNKLKMDYLTMSAKYGHKIWLQLVWNKD